MPSEYSERRRGQAITLFKIGSVSFVAGPIIYKWIRVLELLGALLIVVSLFALFTSALCWIESVIRDEQPTPLDIETQDDEEELGTPPGLTKLPYHYHWDTVEESPWDEDDPHAPWNNELGSDDDARW